MAANTLKVFLHWRVLADESDPAWQFSRTLYAYLAPVKPKIYYIGKCDGTTVRSRWRYDAKERVWNCINQRSKTHRLVVAEIELPVGTRLSRELLADIESLLIYHVQPECNEQARISRIERPGLEVHCLGSWPLSRRVFKDE